MSFSARETSALGILRMTDLPMTDGGLADVQPRECWR